MDELDNRHSGFWRSLLRWLWTVKTPLKMLATDAKNAKNRTRSEFFYDGRKFRRQCANVIDITWGRIYFSTCENFGRKIRTQCAMALMHKNGIWPEWKCKFTLIRWHFQKFDTAQLSVSACQERNSNSIYMFLNSHSDFCIKHQVLVLCNSSGSGNVTKSTNLIGWPHFSQIKMFITSNICLGVTRGQLHKLSHHVKTVS